MDWEDQQELETRLKEATEGLRKLLETLRLLGCRRQARPVRELLRNFARWNFREQALGKPVRRLDDEQRLNFFLSLYDLATISSTWDWYRTSKIVGIISGSRLLGERAVQQRWRRFSRSILKLGFDIRRSRPLGMVQYRLDWPLVREMLGRFLDAFEGKPLPKFSFGQHKGSPERNLKNLRKILWGASHPEGKMLDFET